MKILISITFLISSFSFASTYKYKEVLEFYENRYHDAIGQCSITGTLWRYKNESVYTLFCEYDFDGFDDVDDCIIYVKIDHNPFKRIEEHYNCSNQSI